MPSSYPLTPAVASVDERLRSLVDDLHEVGWSEQDGFLPPALTRALALECQALARNGALASAGVGAGPAPLLRTGLRGDRIQWLEAGQSDVSDRFLSIMESLRMALNRELFLGLAEYEGHFALYPPGAAYQRHRDQFRHDDSRVISVIVYLNARWLPAHGGALRMYPEPAPARDVLPVGGRIVMFSSADMQHEVLPAARDRLSIAGWFRRRS